MMIRNSEFLARVLAGASGYGWVCAFANDPGDGDGPKWFGRPWLPGPDSDAAVDAYADRNSYFGVAELRQVDGRRGRLKQNFQRLRVLVVDDVVDGQVMGVPTYSLETSPGKVQTGVFIDPEDTDAADAGVVDALMSELYRRKLLGDNSGNNLVRYVRLPEGTNTKARASGPFQHRLLLWNPNQVMSLDDAAAVFGIDLAGVRSQAKAVASDSVELGAGQDQLLVEAVHNVVTGSDYHESINRVAASMAASGAHPGAVTNLLRALMGAAQVPRDARWQQRYDDIPRAVETAKRKYQVEPWAPPGEPQDKPPLLMRADALAGSLTGVDWLVRGWLERGAMSMMFGPPNVGKSFIAYDMAMSVATGRPWHGHVVKQGPVVLVVGEGHGGVIRRLLAWAKARGLSDGLTGVPIYITTRAVPMLNGASAMELVAAVDAAVLDMDGLSPQLVVIDTLARNFGDGDENSAKDANAFVDALDDLMRRRYRAHVLIVHHSGHEAGRARGSSAFRGAMDQEIAVAPALQGQIIKVEARKMKDAVKPPPLDFRLTEICLGEDGDGDITSAVATRVSSAFDDIIFKNQNGNVTVGMVLKLVADSEFPSIRGLAEALNISKNGATSALARVQELGYAQPSPTAPSKKVLTELGQQLLSRAGALLPDPDGDAEAEA